MKTHTSEFKNKIKEFGRELDSKITYTINNEEIELGNEELNSITPHYEGAILKSVMKQLDIDSNVEIPVGTILRYQFGVKINGEYEYIDYGNYVVKTVEKQEDTNSWKITCYDKMLYAMKDYENSNITFPITIRNYISAISQKMGLTFANASNTFANYNKEIPNELFLDSEGKSMNYTFRDVLDQLAQVTASTICINEDDELEVRYINQTIGKNLWLLPSTSTANGITYTKNGDGTFNLSGTATARTAFLSWFPLDIIKNNTYYTLSSNFIVSGLDFRFEEYTGINGTFVKQYNILGTNYDNPRTRQVVKSTGTYVRLAIVVENGTTINQNNIKVQLEEGSATSFEPYGETIDEEFLKDVNVNFGEKFGPVNTIILSRGGDGDKILLSQPANLPDEDKVAIQITDNQIMNDNNRNEYMADILDELYGLEYYINDFASTGICYLDLCDAYNIKIDNNTYKCIMFNDETNITQGLVENIYTDMLEESEQEYKYMSSTDKGISQANIIANKAEATVTEYTQKFDDTNNRLTAVETKQTATDRTISIISTNIDSTTGDVNAVTTKEKKFTLNDNGLNITSSDNTFKSKIDESGVFFEDGSSRVAEYTKDGSKQKDLQLFGVYYYGMRDIEDTPMFVAQLYTDNDGEECFGHFYNGGDY